VNALTVNTTGFENTAVGKFALFWNSMGIQNVAIGRGAATNTTGNNNTAMEQILYPTTKPTTGPPALGGIPCSMQITGLLEEKHIILLSALNP
jgi:hypothetical protein